METIDGQRYYHHLKEGKKGSLLDSLAYRKISIHSGVTVCRNVMRNGILVRLFTWFPNHFSLLRHIMRVEQSDRSFFEVIFGTRNQKPHFDIDIEDMTVDDDELLGDLVGAIKEALSNVKINVDPSNILIYASKSNTSSKRGYHVIINGYVHSNHIEAKNFSLTVKSLMQEKYREYIDPAVYNAVQQFRLLWCNKLKSDRVKLPIKHPFYPSFEYLADEFLASLVGIRDGCMSLPPFVDPSGSLIIDADGAVNNDVSVKKHSDRKPKKPGRDDEKAMMKMLSAKMNNNSNKFFEVRDHVDGIIVLTRKEPYYCPICSRQHDNENPFFSLNADGIVYYHCRRADASLRLGELTHLAAPPEDISDDVECNHVRNNINMNKLLKQLPPKIQEKQVITEDRSDHFIYRY